MACNPLSTNCKVCGRKVSKQQRYIKDLDSDDKYHLKCFKRMHGNPANYIKSQPNQAGAVITAAAPIIQKGAQMAARAIQRRGIVRTAQDVAQMSKDVKATVGAKVAKNIGVPLKRKNAEKLAKQLEAGGYSVIIGPEGKRRWIVQIENPARAVPHTTEKTWVTVCPECSIYDKGKLEECPECGSTKVIQKQYPAQAVWSGWELHPILKREFGKDIELYGWIGPQHNPAWPSPRASGATAWQENPAEVIKMVVRKAVDEERGGGFESAARLPKTMNELKRRGVPVKPRQELRSLITDYEGSRYLLYLIDGTDGKMYWAVWRWGDDKKLHWAGHLEHCRLSENPECPACHGAGKVAVKTTAGMYPDTYGTVRSERCPYCGGTGGVGKRNPAWPEPRAAGATAWQESRRENKREPWMMQWLEDYIDSLEEEEYEVLDIIKDRARAELSPEKFEALMKEIEWIDGIENPTPKGWEVIDSGGKQVGGPFETEQSGWEYVMAHGGPDVLSAVAIEANPEPDDIEEFEAKYYPPEAPRERENPSALRDATGIIQGKTLLRERATGDIGRITSSYYSIHGHIYVFRGRHGKKYYKDLENGWEHLFEKVDRNPRSNQYAPDIEEVTETGIHPTREGIENPHDPMDVEGLHMAKMILGKENPEEQPPAQPTTPPAAPPRPTIPPAEAQRRIQEIMARMARGEITEHEGVVAMRGIMATSTPAAQDAAAEAMIRGDVAAQQRAGGRTRIVRRRPRVLQIPPGTGVTIPVPLPPPEEMERLIREVEAQVASIEDPVAREAEMARILRERGGQAAQAMFQGPHGPYHVAYTRLKPAVVKIVRDFIVRERPWRGTAEEKQAKFEAVIKKLARHYEVRPPTLHISDPEHAMGSGYYDGARNHIELPHYSVVTLLHEFKHAMQHLTQQPNDEEVARGWSLSVFYKAAPKHFKRAVERAIIFFITPPDLEGRLEPMLFAFAETPSPSLPILAPLKARLEEMGYRTELRDGMAKLARDGQPTQAKLLYTNAPGFVVDRALKYHLRVPDTTYRGEVDEAQMRITANPRRKGKSFARGRFEIRPTGQYIREQVEGEDKFDDRSFKTVTSGKRGHKVVIGCPKGKWSPDTKRCSVGTRAQSVLHPLSEAEKYGFDAEELVAAGIPMAPPPEVVAVLENPDPYYYSSEAVENPSPEAIGKGAGAAAEIASMAATGAAMGSIVPGVGTAIGGAAGAGAAVAKQAYDVLKERKRKKAEAAAAAGAPKANPDAPQALIEARDLM